MREQVKKLELDRYEEGAVIEGLNRIRTEQLDAEGAADFVSDLMLKILRAPAKNRGGAAEQAGYCRDCGDKVKQSHGRHDEAR